MDISPRRLLPPSIWSKVTQEQRDQLAADGTDLGLAVRKAERVARDLLTDNRSTETEKEAFALLRAGYRRFIEGAYDLSVKAALDVGAPLKVAVFDTGKRLRAALDDEFSPDKTESFRLKDVLLDRQLYWRAQVLRQRSAAGDYDGPNFQTEQAVPGSTNPNSVEGPTPPVSLDPDTQQRQPNSPERSYDKSSTRRAAVDTYIEEIFQAHGIRITKSQIWRAAGYSDDTQFLRWRNGRLGEDSEAAKSFRRMLIDKPHLQDPMRGRLPGQK